ncbi:hypothetical protein [Streptomyces clavuligerus]|uniref:hypothetical protein n=2 Tax=Streptomyces clavuligerus TaxID=1901 RepID=UPI00020D9287|nr:hypothetical protein [Streptomyces clavuligerus]WDN55972.1 hypothetical protein LL058_29220 [Streptomyces clavuligerus]
MDTGDASRGNRPSEHGVLAFVADLAARITRFLLDQSSPLPIAPAQAGGFLSILAPIAEFLLQHEALRQHEKNDDDGGVARLAAQTRMKARRAVDPGDMAALVALVQLTEAVQDLLPLLPPTPAPAGAGRLRALAGGAR